MPVLRCLICDRPFATESTPAMPFCSLRCKSIDRQRWLSEEYGLPYESGDERPDDGQGRGDGDS